MANAKVYRKRRGARSRRVREVPAALEETRYAESSAIIAALMENEAGALRELERAGRYVTSALTLAECCRALLKARRDGRISETESHVGMARLEAFWRRCSIVGIADEVLERAARAFPVEPVRTLDAIHLATAELWSGGEKAAGPVTMLTRDTRIRENARAMGFRVA